MDDYTLYDKIESYIKGMLSLEETQKFEQDIAKNPDLADTVQMHRLEWDAMEVIIENDLRDKMATWKKQTATNPDKLTGNTDTPYSPFTTRHSPLRKSLFINPRFYYGLAAAASVALLIAASVWFFQQQKTIQNDIVKSNTPTNTPLPKDTTVIAPPQYKTPLKPKEETKTAQAEKKQTVPKHKEAKLEDTDLKIVPPSTDDKTYIADAETAYHKSDILSYENRARSKSDDTPSRILDEAGKAYDKKEFEKTIALLQHTSVTDENFMALEFLAHAQFQNKNYNEALTTFQNLLTLSGKKSHDKSEWFVLLCYLANYSQHKTDFQTLANKILAHKTHNYFDETAQLLRQVNEK